MTEIKEGDWVFRVGKTQWASEEDGFGTFDFGRWTPGKVYKVRASRHGVLETHDDDNKPYLINATWGFNTFVKAPDVDLPKPEVIEALIPTRIEPAPDVVYQPHHYARFTIEPITFINANNLPYNIGNVIKYACRYDAKNGEEDLRKAIRYLEMQIETIRREARIEAGEDARDVWKDKL